MLLKSFCFIGNGIVVVMMMKIFRYILSKM